jgi:hypothetical protein
MFNNISKVIEYFLLGVPLEYRFSRRCESLSLSLGTVSQVDEPQEEQGRTWAGVSVAAKQNLAKAQGNSDTPEDLVPPGSHR